MIKSANWNEINRPKKVMVLLLESLLFFSKKISLHLPKFLADIQRYTKSQEQYWAREVAWAARQVEDSGVTLIWRKARDLTNMRRGDFEACLPYISDYAECEIDELLHLL